MSRYSQTGEHLKIIQFLGDNSSGFYIDVGCNEPFHDSVSSYFYDQGWSGICIDANEKITTEFKAQRPRDIVINVGVGDKEGEFTYYDFGGTGGVNTFNPILATAVSNEGFISTTKKVNIKTLTNILDEYDVPEIDFLKIDVEGLDFAAIRSLDLQKYKPKLILYENASLIKLGIDKECDEYLTEHDYEFVFDDGLNCYYLYKDTFNLLMNTQSEIPKIIWQTYKDPYKDLPEYAVAASQTWSQLNPGWQHRYMDDEKVFTFVKNEYGDEWYDIFKNKCIVGVMRADLWRYMVIYRYGGIYTDLDTVCLKPIDSWLQTEQFVDKKMIINAEYENQIAQWTFAATPGHPVLGRVLDTIKENFKNPNYDDPHFVHNTTANTIWSRAIFDYLGYDLVGDDRLPNVDLINNQDHIDQLNNNPKALESGLYLVPSYRWFHWEVSKHLYGSQAWNDGRYVRWIAERWEKNPGLAYDQR